MVLGSVADLLTDDIFLEKILGNYPQPSIDIEQWLRNNYGDSLEEAFAAKTSLFSETIRFTWQIIIYETSLFMADTAPDKLQSG